jgi:hypothetical protein
LGSGQYGVVFKGSIQQKDSEDNIEQIPIAVKTVRPNVPIEYFKALLSELKILAFIGQHARPISKTGSSLLGWNFAQGR